jgi:hypothetical protein
MDAKGPDMLFREEDEDLEILPFADRAEAGLILAGRLAAYSGRADVIVLGLRGVVCLWQPLSRARSSSPSMSLW